MAKLDKMLILLQKMQEDLDEIKTSVDEIKDKMSFEAAAKPTEFPIKFPITTEAELENFDSILEDEDEFVQYAESFNDKITTLRSATALYNRRRSLKELLFSE